MQDHEKTGDRASHIEEHLHDVGPDDGGHAALKCVEERQAHNDGDRGDLARAQDNGNDDRNRKNANALGQRAEQQESTRRELADSLAEAPAHQFVRGVHLSAEILRQEQY